MSDRKSCLDDDCIEIDVSGLDKIISEIRDGSKDYVTAFIAGGVFWVRDAIDLDDAFEKVIESISVSVKPTTVDDLELIKVRARERFEAKVLEFPPVSSMSSKYYNYVASYGGIDRVPINLSISNEDNINEFLGDKTDDVLANLFYEGDDEKICRYYREKNNNSTDNVNDIYVIHVYEGIIPLKGVIDTEDALNQAREIAWCDGRLITDHDYQAIDEFGSRSTERLYFGENYIK